jgi:hypothetical protein
MLVWAASYKVLRLTPILWTFTNLSSTVNTILRRKFGIPRCPQPGEQVRKQCPTTAWSPLPGISSPSSYFQLWSSRPIQWSKVDRYISGRNSIGSNSNSFLPPILIICNRHSFTKLILITQLTKLTLITQLTQLTQVTITHSTLSTSCHSLNSS